MRNLIEFKRNKIQKQTYSLCTSQNIKIANDTLIKLRALMEKIDNLH